MLKASETKPGLSSRTNAIHRDSNCDRNREFHANGDMEGSF